MKKLVAILLCAVLLAVSVCASAASVALVPFFSKWAEACKTVDPSNVAYEMNVSMPSAQVEEHIKFQVGENAMKADVDINGTAFGLYADAEAAYVTVAGMTYAMKYTELLNAASTLLAARTGLPVNVLGDIVPVLQSASGDLVMALLTSDCLTIEQTSENGLEGMHITVDGARLMNTLAAFIDTELESNAELDSFLAAHGEELGITKEALASVWKDSLRDQMTGLCTEGQYTLNVNMASGDGIQKLDAVLDLGEYNAAYGFEFNAAEDDGCYTAYSRINDTFSYDAKIQPVQDGYELSGNALVNGEEHTFLGYSFIHEEERTIVLNFVLDDGSVFGANLTIELDEGNDINRVALVGSVNGTPFVFELKGDTAATERQDDIEVTIGEETVKLYCVYDGQNELTMTYDIPSVTDEVKMVSTISEGELPSITVIGTQNGETMLTEKAGFAAAEPMTPPANAFFLTAEMLGMLLGMGQ